MSTLKIVHVLFACVGVGYAILPNWPDDFDWYYTGINKNVSSTNNCVKVDTWLTNWNDNYLCVVVESGVEDPSFEWSTIGQIGGKKCVHIQEPNDNSGSQNYLCMKDSAYNAYNFQWSSNGKIPNTLCIPFREPSSSQWENNYLCATSTMRYPYWPSEFAFANSGKKSGYTCIQIAENEEPLYHFWYDNYMCVKKGNHLIDPRIVWSQYGEMKGMRCVQIEEPGDSNGWDNNYLCVSEKTPYYFTWTYKGLNYCSGGQTCIQWYEIDPHFWYDNYLCNETSTGVAWYADKCSSAHAKYNFKQVTGLLFIAIACWFGVVNLTV